MRITMRRTLEGVAIAGALLMALSAGPATAEMRELSDAEMSEIVARGVTDEGEAAPNRHTFLFRDIGGRLTRVDGSGELLFDILPLPGGPGSVNVSDIRLSGNAQQNLQAMINFNAANAIVQVQLNLNINVNSRVDSVVQGNLGGFLH